MWLCPFPWRAGSPCTSHNVAWAEAYLHTKWHPNPSNRLATIDVSKMGAVLPLGGAGSPSKTIWPRPRTTSVPSCILIHPAVWPQRTWAENWGLCHFGGARFPYNTMWPGPRPTFTLSFILIHPTVWPQYTNVTYRQDRRDRQNRTDIGPIP